MARLTLSDVSFTYSGANRLAIDNISASLETGRLVVLLGANGSGKSTLGRMLAGLLTPAKGTVQINGKPLPSGWSGVGIIFQNPDEQLFNATVEREIAWGLENLSLSLDEMKRRVSEILRKYNLEGLSDREPFTLSDGQKQLVALAAVEAMSPAFLILDEPTAFLDPWWKKRFRELIRNSNQERGALWISVRAEEAEGADEVWVLKDGRIIERGEPERILNEVDLEKLGIMPRRSR